MRRGKSAPACAVDRRGPMNASFLLFAALIATTINVDELASAAQDKNAPDGRVALVEARHQITISDARESQEMPAAPNSTRPGMDVTSVTFESDGFAIHVTVELARDFLWYAEQYGDELPRPIEISFDTDDDYQTGGETFSMREGYESAVIGDIGAEYVTEDGSRELAFGYRIPEKRWERLVPSFGVYQVPSESWSSPRIIERYSFPADAQLAASELRGRTLSFPVPYEAIGVESGQTIRITTLETHALNIEARAGSPYLNDVRLELR